MASSPLQTKLACLFIITFVVATAPHTEAVMSCSAIGGNLGPCRDYLRQGGARPPQQCCDGVKTVHTADQTTADHQATCKCIKILARTIGAKQEFVNNLSSKCGVSFPFTYSPSLDCSKVN